MHFDEGIAVNATLSEVRELQVNADARLRAAVTDAVGATGAARTRHLRAAARAAADASGLARVEQLLVAVLAADEATSEHLQEHNRAWHLIRDARLGEAH